MGMLINFWTFFQGLRVIHIFWKYPLIDGMGNAHFKGYALCFCQMFQGLRLFQGLHLFQSLEYDIYYIKQTNVFWEHNDTVGRGTTANSIFELS